MFRFTSLRSRQAPGGFTLWELVLALAVLAILIGLTWPAVTGFIGENRLKEDTGNLRNQLATTRSLAIRNGVTFQFRFEPGGRRYVILPLERPVGLSRESSSSSAADSELQVQAYQLAEGNRFEVQDPASGANLSSRAITERLTEDWLQLFGGSSQLAQVTWSPAIQFRPDGTSDDVYFFVQDEEGRYQQVTVRGLTSAVSIGDLDTERKL
jgi:prepilin-type N-terminal cleavage/methylation domain-containing protein